MTWVRSPGGSTSTCLGDQRRGQVVGYGDTPSGAQHAFLWQNGKMTDLGTLPGGSSSTAYGINDRGQIVGESNDASNNADAVLWSICP